MFRIAKRMVHVDVFRALEDNFMYIIRKSAAHKEALVVDPVEPEKLEKFAKENELKICGSLVTHHHWDHAGGTPKFREIHSNPEICPIIGGDERIEKIDRIVKHNDQLTIAEMRISCLSTPCHTKGHICFHVTDPIMKHGVVLTGDTLFIAGCGKFFEGTAPEMHRNLNEVLASLPDETRVYPGHEYTVSNLKFARTVEPNNKEILEKIEWAAERRAQDEDTVPSTIGGEKMINPFMRTHHPDVQKFVGSNDTIEAMRLLRKAKDEFRAPKI